MDRIRLEGIRAFGHHGVLAHEKADGQEFVVDVELEVDLAPAGRSDDLADTVNYALVAERVVADVEEGSLDLIEALATRIARTILSNDEAVDAVRVVVHKPHAPIPSHHGHVSVDVRRTRKDLP